MASTDITDIPASEFSALTSTGLVVGKVGPGAPPKNELAADVTLIFEQGDRRIEVTAADGQYRVELWPGSWQVRSTDAFTCASGIDASVATLRRYDLPYPLQGCKDLSGPPENAPRPPDGETPK